MNTKVSYFLGNKVVYHSGSRVREISSAHLKDIRSRVRTHEGELLTGANGRKYLDKYSKKYLGKDLERSYQDQNIYGGKSKD